MGRITHQDTYSGQLFWHGHGCALLSPEPNQIGTGSQQHWQDVYAEGVRVGDVGLISDCGDFLSLFNIFKPINDPVNRIYGVPSDFQPLEFRENLLSSSSGLYHLSNARILSKDTKEIKLSADGTALAPGLSFAPGLGFEFQFSRTQGAILMLPEGARRVNYLGLPDIRDYTKRNAESWYRFIKDQVRMDAPNGSLYVITGYDRTHCYENIAFQSSSKSSSFYFRAGDLGRLGLSRSSLPEHEQFRKASNPGHTLHNLSPFIRGFKVMINQRFRHKSAIKVLALHDSKVDPKALLYRGSVPSLSSGSASSPNGSSSSSAPVRSPALRSTSSSSRSTRSSDSQISSPGGTLELSPITSYSSLAGDSNSASDSLSPRGSSIFDSDSESEPGAPVFPLCHPSDIINEYILDKLPHTVVAVTHDDEWASVLEETDTEFPGKSTLISRMLKKFPSKFEPAESLSSKMSYENSFEGASGMIFEAPEHYNYQWPGDNYSRPPSQQSRSFSYQFGHYPYEDRIVQGVRIMEGSNGIRFDAPMQAPHYATPSATSRKKLPAVFARKRNRSQAFGDEEDELAGDAPGPNATEKEQIEWKRRQNTLAARKSRKRKLERQQMLEARVDELTVECERWKTKAQTLEQILRSHQVPFSFDEST